MRLATAHRLAAAAGRWSVRAGRAVADVAAPALCQHCDDPTLDGAALCELCKSDLDLLAGEPACTLCGRPLREYGDACPHCRGAGLRPLSAVHRLAPLAGPARSMVLAGKYRGRWWAAERLGQMLWQRPEIRDAVEQADAVVAVPLHWRRELWRGYNQAHQLAKILAKMGGVDLARPAIRVRPTTPQVYARGRTARARNVRRAFDLLAPAEAEGRRLVLVDDVLTTGSTLRTLARALLPAQPAEMVAVVAAVTDP